MKAFLVFVLTIMAVDGGELEQFRKEAEARGERKKIDNIGVAIRNSLIVTNRGRVEGGYVSTNHGIIEIGMERGGSAMAFRQYTFVITNDGRCRYLGYGGGDRAEIRENKKGAVSIIEFHRLAQLAREINFLDLDDDYFAPVMDASPTYLSVVVDGKRKVIRNYALAGPSGLWAMETLMDQMLKRVKWD